MDAAYAWQCAQVGVPAHPALLHAFADYARRVENPGGGGGAGPEGEVLRLGGGPGSPPIRDADVVPVCLAVRSLARTTPSLPQVRLDLTGEPITCEGAKTIAAVLQVNCGLRAVILRRTRVSDNGAAALGAAVGGSSLTELDLGECAIRDAGVRLFVRGIQLHSAQLSLAVLLLDGNPIGDAGVVEIISLVEGARLPHLAALAARPAPPRGLSAEVDAALQVVCQLCRVELCSSGARPGAPQEASVLSQAAQTPTPHGAAASAQPLLATPHSRGAARRSASPAAAGGWTTPMQHAPMPAAAPPAAPLAPPMADLSGGHLAAWMAGTERELRELKWLLGSSAARLDGQHVHLMSELDKLKGQLDGWERAGCGSARHDEGRLEVLEARFDALERLVGREQSECAQMWQIVEVAAGAGSTGSADPRSAAPASAWPPALGGAA